MGMNNADFLSDAVALDLGKSGVKVAETLEIQVGEEWWRLINAADVSTVRAYQGRQFPDPIVVGGKILLEDFASRRGIALPPANNTSNPWKYQMPGVTGFLTNGTMFHAIMAQYSSWNGTGTSPVPRLRVYTENGAVLGTAAASSGDSAPTLVPNALLWDGVNRVLIGVVTNVGNTQSRFYGGGTDGASFALSGGYFNQNVAEFRDAKTFLEDQAAIYSVFVSSGGAVRVRKTTPGAGATPYTVGSTVITPGGTTVSVVVQATGAWLFFSRWHESAAVMWQENATKLCYYATEADGWAVAYPLPNITNGAEWTIRTRGAGNLAVADNGEFITVGIEKIPAGNLTRPTGWVYPANFKILGCAGTSYNTGAILACVGTTIYHLEVDLSTFSISTVATVATSVNFSNLNVLSDLVYVAGKREIWVFNIENNNDAPYGNNWGMLCYDGTSETIPWIWTVDNFEDSSLFPQTYTAGGGKNHIITRFGNNLQIWRLREYYTNPRTYRSENYLVPLSTIASAVDIAAVKAALTTSGRHYVVLPSNHQKPNTHIARNHVIEDDAYYYLFCLYNTVVRRMRFAKDTGVPQQGFVEGARISGFGGRMLFDAPQRFVDYGYFQTQISTEALWQDEFVAYLTGRGYPSTDLLGAGRITPVTNQVTLIAPGYQGLETNLAVGIPISTRNSRLWAYGAGTKFTLLGVTFDGGQDVGMDRQDFTIAHTHHRVLYEPVGGKILSLSAVTGGEIKYAAFCDKGAIQKTVAVDNAGSVYEVDGLDIPGGVSRLSPMGRGILCVGGAGTIWMYDLMASLTEGVGGGSSGGEVSGGYAYLYTDRVFTPYPFAREGIRAELSNISKTTKITLPETQDNLIRGMLAAGTDFRGSRCILRRVFPDHIDEPGADIVLLDGYIQDWSYVPGKKGIAFSVSKTLIDVGAQFPKRLMNMGCSHVFKGSRCRYLGEEGRCLKTRAFCTSLSNLNQFGGFPWVAARQRRVMWK